MKCPKCGYLGFETGDRCRNCGYDFSLVADASTPEVPILREAEPLGPLADLPLREPPRTARARLEPGRGHAGAGDLPLFGGERDEPALIPKARPPRPPLAVRRSTPEAPRVRRESTPPLALGLELESAWPDEAESQLPGAVLRSLPRHAIQEAGALRRLGAATLDAAILLTIDLVVLYLTLRLCGLRPSGVGTLPLAPLAGFLIALNGAYLVAFTAISGQTIGKMALGIRIVSESGPIDLGRATLRTAAYLVSVLPLGLGFVPALVGKGHRALHDRLAGTRVVRFP